MASERLYGYNSRLIHLVTHHYTEPGFTLLFHKTTLPCLFSFFYNGFYPGNGLFSPGKFTVIYQLPGSQAKTQIKKLLMNFLKLFGQFYVI